MKKIRNIIVLLLIVVLAVGCASTESKWQKKYDLGVRYLSEANYEEAIIAFSAAIEIDDKKPLAYIGRGDAYMLFVKTEESWATARVDYETAISMDASALSEENYLSLADIYIYFEQEDLAETLLAECPYAESEAVVEKLSQLLEAKQPIEIELEVPEEIVPQEVIQENPIVVSKEEGQQINET